MGAAGPWLVVAGVVAVCVARWLWVRHANRAVLRRVTAGGTWALCPRCNRLVTGRPGRVTAQPLEQSRQAVVEVRLPCPHCGLEYVECLLAPAARAEELVRAWERANDAAQGA